MTRSDHAGHIGSDDLIHVDIDDVALRLYVFLFLKADLGQKQMKKNEYGTIQQHLEPAHLRELLVPLLTDWSVVEEPAQEVLASLEPRKRAYGSF